MLVDIEQYVSNRDGHHQGHLDCVHAIINTLYVRSYKVREHDDESFRSK